MQDVEAEDAQSLVQKRQLRHIYSCVRVVGGVVYHSTRQSGCALYGAHLSVFAWITTACLQLDHDQVQPHHEQARGRLPPCRSVGQKTQNISTQINLDLCARFMHVALHLAGAVTQVAGPRVL